MSPALAGRFFTTEPPGKSLHIGIYVFIDLHGYLHTYIYIFTYMHIYVCICVKSQRKPLRKSNYSEVFENLVDGELGLERLIQEKKSIKLLQYFIFHY